MNFLFRTFFILLFSFHSFLSFSQIAWINEIHYENTGIDTNEGIEIVAHTDSISEGGILQLNLINGNGETSYKSVNVTENYTSKTTIGAYTVFTCEIEGIQNADAGKPDGIVLRYEDVVLEFISYEGVLSEAIGLYNAPSTDIGVSESSATPTNYSLQRTDLGTYGNWANASTQSFQHSNTAVGQFLDRIPEVSAYTPSDSTIFYKTDTTISIHFYEKVNIHANGVRIVGSKDGDITYVINTSDQQLFTITTDSPMSHGQNIEITIDATKVESIAYAGYFMNADYLFDFDIIPSLIINEFLASPPSSVTEGDSNQDGTRDAQDDEFVEIYNPTSEEIDLSAYTLSDNNAIRHIFSDGTLLKAKESIIVFGGGSPSHNFACAQYAVASTGTLSLNNTNSEIILKDDSDHILDQVSYGSEVNDAQSLVRFPEIYSKAFVKHTEVSDTYFSVGSAVNGTSFVENCPRISFTNTAYQINETDTESFEDNSIVHIERTGDLSGTVTFDIKDLGTGNATGGGVVSLGVDYQNSDFPFEISFADGEGGTKSINIPIYGDTEEEDTETIDLGIEVKTATSLPYVQTRFATLSIIDNEETVLPVELISFEGSLVDDFLSLDWILSSSLNTNKIQIEVSENGIEWLRVGEVATNAESVLLQNFHWEKNIFPMQVHYARLKMIAQGSYFYSEKNFLAPSFSTNFVVYPNPVRNGERLRIKTSLDFSIVEIQIMQMNGVILQREYISSKERNISCVPLSFLNGMYMLCLVDENGQRDYQKILIR